MADKPRRAPESRREQAIAMLAGAVAGQRARPTARGRVAVEDYLPGWVSGWPSAVVAVIVEGSVSKLRFNVAVGFSDVDAELT
jgi:hypothetical protein